MHHLLPDTRSVHHANQQIHTEHRCVVWLKPVSSEMLTYTHSIYLSEYSRMSIKEVLVEYGIVVGQCLSESRKSRSRNLFQRGLVSLVSYPANINDHSILGIRRHVDDDIGSQAT